MNLCDYYQVPFAWLMQKVEDADAGFISKEDFFDKARNKDGSQIPKK